MFFVISHVREILNRVFSRFNFESIFGGGFGYFFPPPYFPPQNSKYLPASNFPNIYPRLFPLLIFTAYFLGAPSAPPWGTVISGDCPARIFAWIVLLKVRVHTCFFLPSDVEGKNYTSPTSFDGEPPSIQTSTLVIVDWFRRPIMEGPLAASNGA